MSQDGMTYPAGQEDNNGNQRTIGGMSLSALNALAAFAGDDDNDNAGSEQDLQSGNNRPATGGKSLSTLAGLGVFADGNDDDDGEQNLQPADDHPTTGGKSLPNLADQDIFAGDNDDAEAEQDLQPADEHPTTGRKNVSTLAKLATFSSDDENDNDDASEQNLQPNDNHPTIGGKSLSALAEHGIFVSDDSGSEQDLQSGNESDQEQHVAEESDEASSEAADPENDDSNDSGDNDDEIQQDDDDEDDEESRDRTIMDFLAANPSVVNKMLSNGKYSLENIMKRNPKQVVRIIEQNHEAFAEHFAAHPQTINKIIDEEVGLLHNFLRDNQDVFDHYLKVKPQALAAFYEKNPTELNRLFYSEPSVLSQFCDDHPSFMAAWLQNRQATVQKYLTDNAALMWNHLRAHPAFRTGGRAWDHEFTMSLVMSIPEEQEHLIRESIEWTLPKNPIRRREKLEEMAARGESIISVLGVAEGQEFIDKDAILEENDALKLSVEEARYLNGADDVARPERLDWFKGRSEYVLKNGITVSRQTLEVKKPKPKTDIGPYQRAKPRIFKELHPELGDLVDDDSADDEDSTDDDSADDESNGNEETDSEDGSEDDHTDINGDSSDSDDDDDDDDDDEQPPARDNDQDDDSASDSAVEEEGAPPRALTRFPAPSHLLVASRQEAASGKWRLFEEDLAIGHMINIRDEKIITGEERFRETARRLANVDGIVRSWFAVKNFWNRTGRARSGFDERKNKNAPLATSQQGKAAPKKQTSAGTKRSSEELEDGADTDSTDQPASKKKRPSPLNLDPSNRQETQPRDLTRKEREERTKQKSANYHDDPSSRAFQAGIRDRSHMPRPRYR